MTMRAFSPWLLASVAMHLVLLALLALVRLGVVAAPTEEIITMQVVEAAEVVVPEPMPDVPAMAIPPEPRPVHAVTPVHRGVLQPTRPRGAAPREMPAARPSSAPATSAVAPPALLTTPAASPIAAPPGRDGGTGTQGETIVPSGPTYGAAAKGGPTPSYPKLAQEDRLSGTVIVTVTVTAEGGIANLAVQSSGHEILDDAARRAARSWTFTPAMEKGVPTTDVVRLRFHFADGAVEGQVL